MAHKEIGERIREIRHELDISAVELAESLHMSKATIHRYENGEIKTIKMPVIESIARELRCNPVWLIGKSERKESSKKSYGSDRYNDFTKLFDDLIQFFDYKENITCLGRKIERSDRMAVLTDWPSHSVMFLKAVNSIESDSP